VTVAGLVLVRQRPGTASGVIFATIEDEAALANLIIWPKTFERYRRTVLAAQLLLAEGTLQREGLVVHIVAEKLIDLSSELQLLSQDEAHRVESFARADEVKRPGQDARGANRHHAGRRRPAAIPRSRDFH
jgi:error-prone DNA polymerase